MANELENKSLLPLHLGASTADGFLLEAAVVKDLTKNQTLQASLDALFAAVGGDHGSVSNVAINPEGTVITVTFADATIETLNLKQYDDSEVRSLIEAAKKAGDDAQATANTNASEIEDLKTKVGSTSVAAQIKAVTDAQAEKDAAQDAKITANETAITKLNGEDTVTGSVKQIAKEKADAAQTAAEGYTDSKIAEVNTEVGKKVASVSAKDKSIVVDTTSEGASPTTPKVGVQLSANPGILRLETDGLSAVVPAETPYTGENAINVADHKVTLKINGNDKVLSQDDNGLLSTLSLVKVGTPSTGFASQYKLVGKDGATALGVTIDIPKDQFLTSGEFIASATTDDKAIDDTVVVGDPYIKLVVALKDDTTKSIYIPTKSLVDVYTSGNGIDITNHKISVKKDGTSEEFLSVGADGIKVSGIQTAIDSAKDAAIADAEGKVNAVNTTVTELKAVVENADTGLAKTHEIANAANTQAGTNKTAIEKLNGDENVTGSVKKTVKDAIDKITPTIPGYYTQSIATSTTSGVSIAATTHKCGKAPLVQTFIGGEQVLMGVEVDASGNVTIKWNGTLPSACTVVILGK